jgi:hypothetical protein
VFVDSELRFGASTRTYIIRERPQINKHIPSVLQQQQQQQQSAVSTSGAVGDEAGMSTRDDEKYEIGNYLLSSLPESEAELDVSI